MKKAFFFLLLFLIAVTGITAAEMDPYDLAVNEVEKLTVKMQSRLKEKAPTFLP